MNLWNFINSPFVTAIITYGILALAALYFAEKYRKKRDLKNLQLSITDRFIDSSVKHLTNIQNPNLQSYIYDFKTSSVDLRCTYTWILALFPSAKMQGLFVEFLSIADILVDEIVQAKGIVRRNFETDGDLRKAQNLMGAIIRELCNEIKLPLMKYSKDIDSILRELDEKD